MRTLVFLSLLLAGCSGAEALDFFKAAPLGAPNWQIGAAVLWLVVTALLKAKPNIAANEPLELVANLLVRVPLVGQLARWWATPGTVARTAGPPPVGLLLLAPLLLNCAAAAGHYVTIPPDPAACTQAVLRAAKAQLPCDKSPPPPPEEIAACTLAAAAELVPCSPKVQWVADATPDAAVK